jgi:hypothetical protein
MLIRKPLMAVDYDQANQAAGFKLPTTNQKPTIAELKAAISGSGFAARYPASFMFAATKNDLIAVCRAHSIAVAGLPGV